MRLSTIHQVVIGGATGGAGLVLVYSLVQVRAGREGIWGVLAVAAGGCAALLALYLRRFRHRLRQADAQRD